MDKNHFTTILNHFSDSTLKEAEEILSLKSQYPYSQLLHTLSARVSKDHGLLNHQGELQMAAIYAADRTVLKEIISYQPAEEVAVAEEAAPAKNSAADIPVKSEERETPVRSSPEIPVYSTDSENVAEEVMRDLQKLSKLKHDFEMLFVDYDDAIKPPQKESKGSTVIELPDTNEQKETHKSKKERIIELAKALHSPSVEGKTSEKQAVRKKKRDFPDQIIEDIKNTKEEIVPESEKQKEQIEIINQFIKIQPSISNPRDRSLPPGSDLTTIKSGEFGDNVVSETLVDILIKQGKKDKAIEVLKKLIWKYPQKKTYFASQIEELKK